MIALVGFSGIHEASEYRRLPGEVQGFLPTISHVLTYFKHLHIV